MKGVSNEQAEMTKVRGDMKTALTENKDYYEKNKKGRETVEGEALRKNATNVPSALGSMTETCDLFM